MLRASVILILWMQVTICIGIAQDKPTDRHLGKSVPGNCETNSAELDDLRNDALNSTDKEEVIIAIVRLGKRETSRVHNRRRLLAVKSYLIKYGMGAQRIVTAEGERTNGYGRVELYLAGKLRTLLLANPNKALCVECCDPDADSYSYRRKKR